MANVVLCWVLHPINLQGWGRFWRKFSMAGWHKHHATVTCLGNGKLLSPWCCPYGHGEAFITSQQPCVPSAAGRHNWNWLYFCLRLGWLVGKCCHNFFWEIKNKLFFVSSYTAFQELLRKSYFHFQNIVFVFIVYWHFQLNQFKKLHIPTPGLFIISHFGLVVCLFCFCFD